MNWPLKKLIPQKLKIRLQIIDLIKKKFHMKIYDHSQKTDDIFPVPNNLKACNIESRFHTQTGDS